MIIYDTEAWWGYGQYFHFYGSVLFSHRALPQAIVAGALGVTGVFFSDYLRDYIVNPTAYFSAVTVVLGFLLVFRSQLAYNRYWEGRSEIQVLLSKLEDVGIHAKCFVQGQDNSSLHWKAAMGNLLVLYLALGIADLRGDMELDEICEDAGVKLTKAQFETLQYSNYRCYIVNGWIVDAWVRRACQPGGLDASPPVQSRTYQILSEIQLAFNSTKKIQTTPFPYPMMQVCAMLLHLYMFTGPLVIGSFLHYYLLGPVLSMLSVLGFFALNATAEELEDPFGHDPNDLPLDHYQACFRQNLIAMGLMRDPTKARWNKVKGYVALQGVLSSKRRGSEDRSEDQDPDSDGGDDTDKRQTISILGLADNPNAEPREVGDEAEAPGGGGARPRGRSPPPAVPRLPLPSLKDRPTALLPLPPDQAPQAPVASTASGAAFDPLHKSKPLPAVPGGHALPKLTGAEALAAFGREVAARPAAGPAELEQEQEPAWGGGPSGGGGALSPASNGSGVGLNEIPNPLEVPSAGRVGLPQVGEETGIGVPPSNGLNSVASASEGEDIEEGGKGRTGESRHFYGQDRGTVKMAPAQRDTRKRGQSRRKSVMPSFLLGNKASDNYLT